MKRVLTVLTAAVTFALASPTAWASWSGTGSAVTAMQAAARTKALQTSTITTSGGGALKCPGTKKVQVAWTIPTSGGNGTALAGTSYTLMVNGVADPVAIGASATSATSANTYSGLVTVTLVTNYSLWKQASTNAPSVEC